MGVTTASVWTKALLKAGKSSDTPAALIRRCSHGDQQTIHCRLDEVADRLTPASKFRPPVITILGPVTELAETMNWLERRPLFGQTVLVTRPADQAEALAAPIRDLGANVLLQPAIDIGPPDDWSDVDLVIEQIESIDVLVFCSRNGVRYFLDRLFDSKDVRCLASVSIAVVGAKTAEALRDYHLRANIVPPNFHAKSLAQILAQDCAGKHFTIVRASRGDDVFDEPLQTAGANVKQVIAYKHSDVLTPDPSIVEAMKAGRIDWVTVTSSATALSLYQMFGDTLKQTKLACLSPVTAKAVRGLGLHVHAEANPYTVDSLIASIRNPPTT